MNGLDSHNFYYTSPKSWSELGESWYTKARSWRLPGAATLDFTPTAASEYSSGEEGMQTSSNRKPVAMLQLSNILYWHVCCSITCASAPAHPFASWASPTIVKIRCNEKNWTLNYPVLPRAVYTVGWQQLLLPAHLCSACSVHTITSSEPFWGQRWSLAISVCSGVAAVLTLFTKGLTHFHCQHSWGSRNAIPTWTHSWRQAEAGWCLRRKPTGTTQTETPPPSPPSLPLRTSFACQTQLLEVFKHAFQMFSCILNWSSANQEPPYQPFLSSHKHLPHFVTSRTNLQTSLSPARHLPPCFH